MGSNSQTQALAEERAAHTRGRRQNQKDAGASSGGDPEAVVVPKSRCDELNC